MKIFKNVLIEIKDSEVLEFDENKEYFILKDSNFRKPLGRCFVSKKEGLIYADLFLYTLTSNYSKLNKKVYPSIVYNELSKLFDKRLVLAAVGLSKNQNTDKNIKPININD